MLQKSLKKHAFRPAGTLRDLGVLFLLAAVTLAFSIYFDLFDVFVRWYISQEELLEVEEIIVVLLVLGFFFCVYSVRMWIRVGKAERFSRLTLSSLTDYVIILDGNSTVISVNYPPEKVSGLPPVIQGVVEGSSYFTRCDVAADDCGGLAEAIRTVTDGRAERVTLEHSWQNLHFLCHVTSFHVDGEIRVVVCHEDVSELKSAEREVERLAYQDLLTGLPNRRLLVDRLGQAIAFGSRSSSKVGVLFLDLDNFKTINDTLGHTVGDRLLRQIGARLSECVRASDSIGRMGGDEFLLILHGVRNTADIADAATGILRIFDAPFQLDGRQVFMTGSAGVSVYPDDGKTPEELLRNADMAMYRAKNDQARPFAFFTPEMNVEARNRLDLETSLRLALENDEFILHYQPRVDARTGNVTCLEALVRWQHPEEGLVPPASFIPLAEETGLIVPLGEWVIAEVLRHMKGLEEKGHPPVRVSVNVSGKQLRSDFHDRFVTHVRNAGVLPSRVEIEITETALMGDPVEVSRTLKGLKDLGIGISVDDFGTGYSSLNYLRRFPLDTVKIDRSFVKDLPDDQESAAIVMAIIALGRTLNLRVVAEGAETDEQFHWLVGRDCDEVQGYCFSKPFPFHEVGPFLQRHYAARTAIEAAEASERARFPASVSSLQNHL